MHLVPPRLWPLQYDLRHMLHCCTQTLGKIKQVIKYNRLNENHQRGVAPSMLVAFIYEHIY